MSAKRLSLIASTLALVLWSSSSHAQGQPPAALSGTVSSAKEDLMEGVVVSAKLKALAVTPGGNSGADFRAMIDKDIESIAAVIKAANLKFDN